LFFNVPFFAFFYLSLESLLIFASNDILLNIRVLALVGLAFILGLQWIRILIFPLVFNQFERIIQISFSFVLSSVLTLGIFIMNEKYLSFALSINILLSLLLLLAFFYLLFNLIRFFSEKNILFNFKNGVTKEI
jgi:hypothetical protein